MKVREFNGNDYQVLVYESSRTDFFSGLEFNSTFSDKSLRYPLNYPEKSDIYKKLLRVKDNPKAIDKVVFDSLGKENV